jgi:gamma-glutamyl phosphate reductase
MAESINTAIIERLEKVVETLQDNSVKMGQILAVHNEKLDKQDRIDGVLFEKIESVHREVNRQALDIKKGCERDIRKVDDRLRLMEKKMWSIFGGLAIISFLVSPVGQKIIRPLLTNGQASARVVPLTEPPVELSRYQVS